MGSFTVKKVQSLIKEGSPGRFSDGGGLYLMVPKRVHPTGCFDTRLLASGVS